MAVIIVGIALLLLPFWLFIVVGKFIAQFSGSNYMSEYSWWLILSPVWIPIVIFTVVFLGAAAVMSLLYGIIELIRSR